MQIVKFWSRCPVNRPPFIHPDDRQVLAERRVLDQPALNFKRFIQSDYFGKSDDHRFHLSLLPIPYVGDLRQADIFILSLNPGFRPVDYFAENRDLFPGRSDAAHVRAFRRRRIQNLRQKLAGLRFPNMALDPAFSWHSTYWWKKLHAIAGFIAYRKHGGNYLEALAELSRRVAIVELVPYHSSSFAGNWTTEELASARKALQFARTELASRAADDRATVIVTRHVSEWGLKKGRNVVLYEPGQTRTPSLSTESRGGKVILRRMLA